MTTNNTTLPKDRGSETLPQPYIATLQSLPVRDATTLATRMDSSESLILRHLSPPAPVTALEVLRDRSPPSSEEDERPAKKPRLAYLLDVGRQTQHHDFDIQTSPAPTVSRGTQTAVQLEPAIPTAVQEELQTSKQI
ncbi:MAG: hypothetical protein Q9203_006139, partial [Teloschistes exilis]